MNALPMKTDDIRASAIRSIQDSGDYMAHTKDLLITVTNGDSFIVRLSTRGYEAYLDRQELEIWDTARPVFIPFSDVCGILKVSVEQRLVEVNIDSEEVDTPFTSSPLSVSRISSDNFERNIDEYGWRTEKQQVAHSIVIGSGPGEGKVLEWGNLKFESDTPLYWDKNFLIERSGKKIKSMGAGILGFSASAGWSEGLWSEFRKLFVVTVPEPNIYNPEILNKFDGYVDIFKPNADVPNASIKMEGQPWHAGVISQTPIDSSTLSELENWEYCFFADTGFVIDMNLWGNIEERVTVLCEYVPMELTTMFGTRAGFFKVRGAVVLKSD